MKTITTCLLRCHRNITLLALTLLTLHAGSLCAQQSEPAMSQIDLQRQFNHAAFKVISDYSSVANIRVGARQMQVDKFRDLFSSPQTQIYNDLLSLAEGPTLSVEHYIKLLLDSARTTNVSIENVKRVSMQTAEQPWTMQLQFTKHIDFINPCGLRVDAKTYHGYDHQLTMTVAWQPGDETARIVRLTGQVGGDSLTDEQRRKIDEKPFPVKYALLKHTSPGDQLLRISGRKGKPVEFIQPYDMAFLPDNFRDKGKIYYPDPDYTISFTASPSDEGCDQWQTSYKYHGWRMKIHADGSVTKPYITSVLPDAVSTKGYEMGLGIDIGYVGRTKKKTKLGFFTGLAVARSQLELNQDKALSFRYTYGAAGDIDGDSYTRRYTVTQMRQRTRFLTLTMPLYMELEHVYGRGFAIYLDLGMRGNYAVSTEAETSGYLNKVDGFFPDYNLTLDHVWGFDGFTNGRALTPDEMVAPGQKADYSLDAFAAAGFRVRLAGRVWLDINANYLHGIINTLKDPEKAVKWQNGPMQFGEAPVNYLLSRGEQAYPLSAGTGSWKHKRIGISAGLMIKF